MATVRQEMQAEVNRKLQEEREQMAAELKSNMEQELQRKLEEQLEHVNAKVDNRISVEVAKRIQEQLAAIMTGMQQIPYEWRLIRGAKVSRTRDLTGSRFRRC
ncbi:uncharacterized protein LOC107786889 isoform X1 [Nicotiana tabacum]|uniref:Uncharacterized protein LOC107786889 isoform X1 n=3 Tax=Nicotiana tabacum TaxID=4097 RepID=A0AC58U7P9_TOBAC